MELLIASHNPGKVDEFKYLLKDLDIDVYSLLDYPDLPEIEETGTSFEANARLKAEGISRLTQKMVLADDSGLMVDALNGQPGVYSARYAGPEKSDAANNAKLLAELAGKPKEERTAHFVTCLVVASPHKESLVVEGQVSGYILEEALGEGGFGYDPLFYYPPLDKSFGQLSASEKNQVSHRSRALQALVPQLKAWLVE